ncbi:4Fe-4S single cluster domain-containing protein [Metabacillus bambusae]|uniref:Radical SAM protein n=1 Tax=Metabacillus bambusae TaxID=2795218 RepID=A0ABS3NB38_9BACI|nr:4Fe-4S single cluster domain-containing protein [Metabacillus bambusae]MBO1515413.1 radical SAM protein [Metabacillus bambusae]
MKVRIHRFLPFTAVEGPGNRACLWVQGCSIHCKGCGVPWTWRKDGGENTPIDELFEEIKSSMIKNQIEGVTFLGGEPFDQAEALATLGRRLKEIGLSIMTFSGYTYGFLIENKSNRSGWQELLSITDLLIDGPFVEEQLDLSRPWIGSANQNYRFLTDRYKHLEKALNKASNKIEVRIGEDGKVSINGMATQEQLKNLTHGIARREV